MPKKAKLRVAMPSWEIGHVSSGFGAKIGGLAVVVEELPAELIKAAKKLGLDLEIELLSPCFAHYDRTRLNKLDIDIPAAVTGTQFAFEVYEHTFADNVKSIYFWDSGQLSWTNATSIYPTDPQMALKLYAAVSQAMAGYIKHKPFDTVHLHDYHVGLVPFYLDPDFPVHLTIHNASYQGITDLIDGGYSSLDRVHLSGEKLFHKYFDSANRLNLMKACMLRVHETGGKITTVSGDLAGSWGYAAELRENFDTIYARAQAQKGSPPGQVFVPNSGLDVFERLPIAGITNGLSDSNRPENMHELTSAGLARIGATFRNPEVQASMLGADHSFDVNRLQVKTELKNLLHLEAFGTEAIWDPILVTVVGRLVEQKNLGLVLDIMDRALAHDPGVKFIILASAPRGDGAGEWAEGAFAHQAARNPDRVFFNSAFDLPLSKLILAGGDFALIPSRFEPCGLVDYEASLLGNIVVGRATGGLVKVRHCAYLYDWLDISDRPGEANAFWLKLREAIDVYRHDPARHEDLRGTAMSIDCSWDTSARTYIEMYQYGLLSRQWLQAKRDLIAKFKKNLGKNQPLFDKFFMPAQREYADGYDWKLRDSFPNI